MVITCRFSLFRWAEMKRMTTLYVRKTIWMWLSLIFPIWAWGVETGYAYVAQAGFKLVVILPLPLECCHFPRSCRFLLMERPL